MFYVRPQLRGAENCDVCERPQARETARGSGAISGGMLPRNILKTRVLARSWSWAPFIFSKIDISTEWLDRHIQNVFESLPSLTYNRLSKAIWSFIPFRLLFVYPANVYTIAAHLPVE